MNLEKQIGEVAAWRSVQLDELIPPDDLPTFRNQTAPLMDRYGISFDEVLGIARAVRPLDSEDAREAAIQKTAEILEQGLSSHVMFREAVFEHDEHELGDFLDRIGGVAPLSRLVQALSDAPLEFPSSAEALSWAVDLSDKVGIETCIESLQGFSRIMSQSKLPSPDLNSAGYKAYGDPTLSMTLERGNVEVFSGEAPWFDTWWKVLAEMPQEPVHLTRLAFSRFIEGPFAVSWRIEDPLPILILPASLLSERPEIAIPLISMTAAYAAALYDYSAHPVRPPPCRNCKCCSRHSTLEASRFRRA